METEERRGAPEAKSDRVASRFTLGGHSLEELRDHHYHYLFAEYLPFWKRHGIDHERGGFCCALDHDGVRVNDSKYMWYQGRGLWVYSYLYERFGGEEHLATARRTRDFLLRYGRDQQGNWVECLDREGNTIAPATQRGYTGLFVAEGLQAYARTTGDPEAMDVAIASLWRSMAIFDDPQRLVEEGYLPCTYPGQRTLGQHMVTMLILTQVLEQFSDPRLEALADRMVEAIVERFWNPEYRLLNEVLDHHYQRPNDANEDFIYLGHAIETLWMLLAEALRRRDQELFALAAERFRRHLEVAWDQVYEGLFRALKVHGKAPVDKVLWAQEEGMIGTMMLCEHTDWEWPAAWFGKLFDYVEAKFSLKRRGYPLYQYSGDRKVAFQPHVQRQENYHHPRQVMRNLLAVERLLERREKRVTG